MSGMHESKVVTIGDIMVGKTKIFERIRQNRLKLVLRQLLEGHVHISQSHLMIRISDLIFGSQQSLKNYLLFFPFISEM
jgi:predicted nucleotidyltransferase